MKLASPFVIPEAYKNRPYLSPSEAAAMLGMTRYALYQRVMPQVWNGTITSIRVGSRHHLLVASLLAWIAQQEQTTAESSSQGTKAKKV